MLLDRAKPCSITLKYISDLIMVYPDAGVDDLVDKQLRGTRFDGKVVLHLPTPRRVPRITVAISGRCNMFMRKQYTSAEIVHVQQELMNKDGRTDDTMQLPAGDHEFPFSLQVPAHAPDALQCPYGRVYYRLRATAANCGRLGADLTREEKLSVSPNLNPNGFPDPYSFQREIVSDNLGPVRIELKARYLIVAGYITLQLKLASVPRGITVNDVKVRLHQTYTLTREGEDKETGVQTVLVWKSERLDTSLLASNASHSQSNGTEEGGERSLNIVQQMKLPTDHTVSPTTHHGTKTPIAVAHSIETAIMYTTDTDGKRYELKIVDKPLVISSVGRSRSAPRIQVCPEQHVKADQICCCLIENFQLPAYSRTPQEDKTLPETFDLTDIGLCYTCLCRLTDKKSLKDIYGITQEEIEYARQIRDHERTTWKDDHEYRPPLATGSSATEA